MTGEMYFSVDIEADGPVPGPYSMSSFGAVACAVRSGTWVSALNMSNPENQFYAELKPISENFVPEAAAVAGFNRRELIQHGQKPETAMTAFDRWIKERAAGVRPVFVGWPLSYDWMWIYWYLMQYNESSPFGHSSAIDMKTWYAARADAMLRTVGKREVKKRIGVTSGVPHTHNALDDAIEQGEVWQYLLSFARP